jgi:hypothetical protein
MLMFLLLLLLLLRRRHWASVGMRTPPLSRLLQLSQPLLLPLPLPLMNN